MTQHKLNGRKIVPRKDRESRSDGPDVKRTTSSKKKCAACGGAITNERRHQNPEAILCSRCMQLRSI